MVERGLLQNVSGCTGFDAGHDLIRQVRHTEDDHFDLRQILVQSPSHVNPIIGRNTNIYKHHLRAQISDLSQGLAPIFCRPNNDESFLLCQHEHQSLTQQAVVFNNKHSDGLIHLASPQFYKTWEIWTWAPP